MRQPLPFTVFGFDTTHAALDGEALLGDLGIEVVPIPAPPGITAMCGIALRVPRDEAGRAATYLERAQIDVRATLEIEDV